MKHITNFGFLTGLAIIIALLSDFLLGPALMVLITRHDERAKSFKKFHTLVLMIIFLLPAVTVRADDINALKIMQKVENRDDGNNRITTMEMILIDKRGNERTRHIRTHRKDKGKDTMKLGFFIYPPEVKNTAFLTYDYDDPDKDDDQWLYLPALKKTKRIASTDKDKSYMGSDFSYSDMTSLNLEDYDFKLLRTQKVKDKETWLIESLPKTKKVEKETGYSKSLLFVRQDNYVVIRAVYFVKEGKKLKYLDVKKLELINNILVPSETHMTTKKGERMLHKTILKHHDIEFDQDLPDSFFTVRRMEKGL